MRHWNLGEVETPNGTRSPVVLYSQDGEARVVLIRIDPGQALGEHQVKENAWVTVVDGSVRIAAGDQTIEAGPGTVVRFDPDERRSVTSHRGAGVLLFLAPWPGEGHYRGGRGVRAGVSAS